jgi:hypothetical protein
MAALPFNRPEKAPVVKPAPGPGTRRGVKPRHNAAEAISTSTATSIRVAAAEALAAISSVSTIGTISAGGRSSDSPVTAHIEKPNPL